MTATLGPAGGSLTQGSVARLAAGVIALPQMPPIRKLAELTTRDYDVVMRAIGIAELKSKLSAYLKDVERGESLTVLDRQRPIARIVPHAQRGAGLTVRPRRRKPGSLQRVSLPPPLAIATDAVAILLEERQGER